MNPPEPAIDSSAIADAMADDVAPEERSLTDDVIALFDDGKTYLESELQYQRTRAGFAFEKGRAGAAYGFFALVFVHLALVAVIVGALLALTPVVGAWGATGIVVAILLCVTLLFALMAKRRFGRLAAAYRETRG